MDVPLGVLVVVTGVACGGQKLTRRRSFSGRDGLVTVDQSLIRGSRRSNPQPIRGLLGPIRKAFAKDYGVKPALFRANSEGACRSCTGAGVVDFEPAITASVPVMCEECGGKRFQSGVLDYRLGGRDISEVLGMPVNEARDFFAAGHSRVSAAHAILDRLARVGLGYLTIGQQLTTLSGGERARLKLAIRMAEKGGIYVLDEPTSGLHLTDIDHLLRLRDQLLDLGKSVIVIEHHLAVMAHATGSSISAPEPATTGAGSSSRTHRPSWSWPARPSRGSTSPGTWLRRRPFL